MPALSPFSILLIVARHVPLMPVLAAAVMAVLAGLLRRPQVKGWIGEILLHLRLRWALDRQRYRLFHNLILPTSDGSTQIDHVLVSRHGIFVIETKHYGGWIFGGQHDRRWTQKFPRRSHTFQNPLRQNHKHVRALAALTGVDDRLLVSLVVFVGSCTFKTAMPDNVTRPGGCLDAIRARTDTPLSEAEVDAICARIAAGRIAPSRAANAAHARHVRASRARAGGAETRRAGRRQTRCAGQGASRHAGRAGDSVRAIRRPSGHASSHASGHPGLPALRRRARRIHLSQRSQSRTAVLRLHPLPRVRLPGRAGNRRRGCGERDLAPLLLVRGKGAGVERRRLLRHPGNESLDIRIGLQGGPTMVGAQQFALREGRMDLPVADLVDRELLLPLHAFRDQVVAVDVHGPERAPAQGAQVFTHAHHVGPARRL
jgi:hypothetical protein